MLQLLVSVTENSAVGELMKDMRRPPGGNMRLQGLSLGPSKADMGCPSPELVSEQAAK